MNHNHNHNHNHNQLLVHQVTVRGYTPFSWWKSRCHFQVLPPWPGPDRAGLFGERHAPRGPVVRIWGFHPENGDFHWDFIAGWWWLEPWNFEWLSRNSWEWNTVIIPTDEVRFFRGVAKNHQAVFRSSVPQKTPRTGLHPHWSSHNTGHVTTSHGIFVGVRIISQCSKNPKATGLNWWLIQLLRWCWVCQEILLLLTFFGESLHMFFNQEWIKKIVQTFRELFGNGCKCLLLLLWLKISDSPLHLVSHLSERSEGFHSDPRPFNHH